MFYHHGFMVVGADLFRAGLKLSRFLNHGGHEEKYTDLVFVTVSHGNTDQHGVFSSRKSGTVLQGVTKS